MSPTVFDLKASQRRCVQYRRRILEISQKVPALHIGGAFSALELLDTIYFGLMRRERENPDTFILSKGHGAMAQYCILEKLGLLTRDELDGCGRDGGKLGMHPDYGTAGIGASTGSLGHGLPITLGMALADKTFTADRRAFIVMSDGEIQEGSVWESLMIAPTLRLNNIIAAVDLNDFQSLGQISKSHPNFYPVGEKMRAFGWETVELDGHDQQAIYNAVTQRTGLAPFMVVARTTKGKGVSYMENVPIWHYRSPSPDEYQLALAELKDEA